MANQTPSINPADERTLAGVLKTAIGKAMQAMDVMLPVEVVAYDRATNRATVRHLVQMVGSDGEKVSRANIASIRVYQFGNGSFSMSLPIKPGDKGWIMAADRDISIFQQSLTEDAPNTARMHSFQDGLFMPDAMSMGNVQAPDADAVTIQTLDGNTRIAMGAAGITQTVGGASIAHTADEITQTVGGTVFRQSASGFEFTGGPVDNNGTNIGFDHVHINAGGSGNSGPPL